MWIVVRLLAVLALALVAYIDEHLMTKSPVQVHGNIHERVGALLLIGILFTGVSSAVSWWFIEDLTVVDRFALLMAAGSAVPMVLMIVSYFYALTRFPVQVVFSLSLLSTVWLVVAEAILGDPITIVGLLGIFIVATSAALLEAGKSKLVLSFALVAAGLSISGWGALYLFMIERAVEDMSPLAAYVSQALTIFLIGVLLFFAVPAFRRGFLARIVSQPKQFLGLSMLNESLAQLSFALTATAISMTVFVSYVAALEGLVAAFVLVIMLFFPISDRSVVSLRHVVAVGMMLLGSALLAVA